MLPSLRATARLLSPWSAPRRGLFLAISSAVVAICGVFALEVLDARRDARLVAEASEINLATALAHDMDRDIELLDLSMQAARDAWLDPRVRALTPDLRQIAVFDRSVTARYVDAVLVVDAGGAAVSDSRSAVPLPGPSHRDADFFRAQLAADAGLFISHPTRFPGKPGWHLALSRRLAGADGAFAGVVVGFIDLGDFGEAFRHLPLGPGGALILFSTDGTLLLREPEMRGAVGRSFAGQRTFETLKTPESGVFEGLSTLDGRSRLYAFHRVGRRPLVQAVAASTDAVYAGWRAKALALGTALALLCSAIMALLFALKRELLQRAAAERALEALASTDPLTGLLNRRRFFERAEAASVEAAARGAPMSLLMIDADHFKAYNDRYGHAAGDAVLAALGRCIAEAMGAEDVAARYGGEEFIAILPGRDRTAAVAVAEAIRAAVLRLALPHDRASAGFVTVSVGAAASRGGSVRDLRALVEAADVELYRSKREGRNRTSGKRGEGSLVA